MTNEEIDQRIADAARRVELVAEDMRDGGGDLLMLTRQLDDAAWLIEQLQAARKDSLRLDWLAARSRVEVEPDLRPDCGALLSWEPENDIAFRAAIDAAMSAAPLSDKEAANG